MGRPPSDAKGSQLAVSLPPDLRSKVRRAAALSGHSLAEEIRRRVDFTFMDSVTLELFRGLENLSTRLREDFGGEWYDSPRAHQAFMTAIQQRVAQYAPPAESSDRADTADPPDTIGRMRERDDRRDTEYPHMLDLQQGKKTGLPAILAADYKFPPGVMDLRNEKRRVYLVGENNQEVTVENPLSLYINQEGHHKITLAEGAGRVSTIISPDWHSVTIYPRSGEPFTQRNSND